MPHLEDPMFADEITLARGEMGGIIQPSSAVNAISAPLRARLPLIGAAVALGTFRWWAPLLMIGGHLWFLRWSNRVVDNLYAPFLRETPELRRASYYRVWPWVRGSQGATGLRAPPVDRRQYE